MGRNNLTSTVVFVKTYLIDRIEPKNIEICHKYITLLNMFVPITSEVTIDTGMVLKEIATERLFEVGQRLSDKEEVWGDDPWELTEITPGNLSRTAIALAYEELARKYFAEVEG